MCKILLRNNLVESAAQVGTRNVRHYWIFGWISLQVLYSKHGRRMHWESLLELNFIVLFSRFRFVASLAHLHQGHYTDSDASGSGLLWSADGSASWIGFALISVALTGLSRTFARALLFLSPRKYFLVFVWRSVYFQARIFLFAF